MLQCTIGTRVMRCTGADRDLQTPFLRLKFKFVGSVRRPPFASSIRSNLRPSIAVWTCARPTDLPELPSPKGRSARPAPPALAVSGSTEALAYASVTAARPQARTVRRWLRQAPCDRQPRHMRHAATQIRRV